MNKMYRYVQPEVSSSNLLGSSMTEPAIYKGLRVPAFVSADFLHQIAC